MRLASLARGLNSWRNWQLRHNPNRGQPMGSEVDLVFLSHCLANLDGFVVHFGRNSAGGRGAARLFLRADRPPLALDVVPLHVVAVAAVSVAAVSAAGH